MSRRLHRVLVALVIFVVTLATMLTWRGEAPLLGTFVAIIAASLVMKLNSKNIGGVIATFGGAMVGAMIPPLRSPYFDFGFKGGLMVLGAIVGGLAGACLWRVLRWLLSSERTFSR